MSKKGSGDDAALREQLRQLSQNQSDALSKEAAGQEFPEVGAGMDLESLPIASNVPKASDLGNFGGPSGMTGAFRAMQLDQDAQLIAAVASTVKDPSFHEMARNIHKEARRIGKQARYAEPTLVKINGKKLAIPASVMLAPVALHEEHPETADQLFKMFCKGRTKLIMKNAAKAGHSTMPFAYLSQALWHLLAPDMADFQPMPRMDDNGMRALHANDGEPVDDEYDTDDAQKNGAVRNCLEAWAGEDLAALILQRCHRADLSLFAGLRKCFRQLDEARLADIDRCQRHQTARQWIDDSEDETNDD